MDTVVVGVDGSPAAERALAFAAEEASLRGARLRVVCVWEIRPAVYGAGFAPTPDQAALDAFREQAEALARNGAEGMRRAHPGLEVEGVAREGHPAECLLGEAERASLVVVGNRGRGGFASLLLGSVSQQVVHRARCPVVVVR